jgi:hypothetical protein
MHQKKGVQRGVNTSVIAKQQVNSVSEGQILHTNQWYLSINGYVTVPSYKQPSAQNTSNVTALLGGVPVNGTF